MEVTGIVKVVGEVQEIGSNGFRKKEVVLVTDATSDYPQEVAFELHGQKADLTLTEGETINASFNLRGRKWTNKEGKDVYFNTLVIWKFDVVNNEAKDIAPQEMQSTENDDLPF